MKLKKIVASAVAAALSVSAVAVAASAYDIPASQQILDWTLVSIPADVFADLSTDNPYITVEVTKDVNPAGGYHCVKPVLNDWTLICEESMTKFSAKFADARKNDPPDNTFGASSYSVASGDDVTDEAAKYEFTKVTFEVPASMIDQVKSEGMSLCGKGAKATKIYVATEKPTVFYDIDGNEIKDGTDSTPTTAGDSTPTTAGDNTPTTSAAGDVNQPTTDKNSPDTGVEGVAVVAGIAVIAAGALIISKKRK